MQETVIRGLWLRNSGEGAKELSKLGTSLRPRRELEVGMRKTGWASGCSLGRSSLKAKGVRAQGT